MAEEWKTYYLMICGGETIQIYRQPCRYILQQYCDLEYNEDYEYEEYDLERLKQLAEMGERVRKAILVIYGDEEYKEGEKEEIDKILREIPFTDEDLHELEQLANPIEQGMEKKQEELEQIVKNKKTETVLKVENVQETEQETKSIEDKIEEYRLMILEENQPNIYIINKFYDIVWNEENLEELKKLAEMVEKVRKYELMILGENQPSDYIRNKFYDIVWNEEKLEEKDLEELKKLAEMGEKVRNYDLMIFGEEEYQPSIYISNKFDDIVENEEKLEEKDLEELKKLAEMGKKVRKLVLSIYGDEGSYSDEILEREPFTDEDLHELEQLANPIEQEDETAQDKTEKEEKLKQQMLEAVEQTINTYKNLEVKYKWKMSYLGKISDDELDILFEDTENITNDGWNEFMELVENEIITEDEKNKFIQSFNKNAEEFEKMMDGIKISIETMFNSAFSKMQQITDNRKIQKELSEDSTKVEQTIDWKQEQKEKQEITVQEKMSMMNETSGVTKKSLFTRIREVIKNIIERGKSFLKRFKKEKQQEQNQQNNPDASERRDTFSSKIQVQGNDDLARKIAWAKNKEFVTLDMVKEMYDVGQDDGQKILDELENAGILGEKNENDEYKVLKAKKGKNENLRNS